MDTVPSVISHAVLITAEYVLVVVGATPTQLEKRENDTGMPFVISFDSSGIRALPVVHTPVHGSLIFAANVLNTDLSSFTFDK